MVPEQGIHGHHHPGSAESTLGAVTLGNPLLNRVESGRGAAYAFHCGDGCAMQRADGGQAGIDGMMPDRLGAGVVPRHHHRAGATAAPSAAVLRAWESEGLPQVR